MDGKPVRVHNKSDKPDNIIKKESDILEECRRIEADLPDFLTGYFRFLRGHVLPMTRLAYLRDLRFFLRYLTAEDRRFSDRTPREIGSDDLKRLEALDVNVFLDHCRHYKVEHKSGPTIYENDKRALARKRSSLSVLFKYLYRAGVLEKNITEAFDPIKVPKPGEREIKALADDEVMRMLDAVATGAHLTKKEKEFWEKTRHRDKAILLLFLTYGLRISELQQLNLSSFNFSRGEFKIYRKRGKESVMPLNRTATNALRQYLDLERMEPERLAEGEREALFLSLQGRRMTERQIREMVRKYTSIGLATSRREGYSPHKLRATAATSLIGRGHSVYDVQALLDHENVTTTQLYAAHRKNAKRDLIKNFEWDEDK